MKLSWQTSLYRAAAGASTRIAMRVPFVECVYLRRSAASGEVQIPFSDADIAVLLSPASSAEEEGQRLLALLRRFRLARCLFPRLGESLVHARDDFADSIADDPYRASIDRRCAIATFGTRPPWPVTAITPRDALRRLVFWFDGYLPRALRTRNHRNARKFAIEIWNALQTASGVISEPFVTRRESEQHWRCSADIRLLSEASASAEGAVRACLTLATRAHAILRPSLPSLRTSVVFQARFLPGSGMRTIIVVPHAQSPLPPEATRPDALLFTPEILDLFLNSQNPFLWHSVEKYAGQIGLSLPDVEAWELACLRLSAAERLRVPGFAEATTGAHLERLQYVDSILELLEQGRDPGATEPLSLDGMDSTVTAIPRYYREQYPVLFRKAKALRARAASLGAMPRKTPGRLIH